MKDIDRIFYGENGLTSTSANYIANKAKEYIEELEVKFSYIDFVNETLLVPNSTDKKIVRKGMTFKELQEVVNDDIPRMYKIKTLIAWLREAIKHKDDYISSLDREYNISDYMKEVGFDPTYPTQEPLLNEKDVLASWSVEDRKKYYDLETKCAVIGKMIHKDSPLSKGKEEMIKITSAPNRIEKFENSILIYERDLSMKVSDLTDFMFKLQNEHRSYQAELNGLKFKIQETISEDRHKKFQNYQMALQKYNAERDKVIKEWNNKLLEIKDEIGKLKIIIPESLKETYDFVNKL